MDGVDPIIGFFIIIGFFMMVMVLMICILGWVALMLHDPKGAMVVLIRGVVTLIKRIVGLVVGVSFVTIVEFVVWTNTGSDNPILMLIGLVVAIMILGFFGSFFRKRRRRRRYGGGGYDGDSDWVYGGSDGDWAYGSSDGDWTYGGSDGGWGDGGGDGGGGD